jgi:hypothetical protein
MNCTWQEYPHTERAVRAPKDSKTQEQIKPQRKSEQGCPNSNEHFFHKLILHNFLILLDFHQIGRKKCNASPEVVVSGP